jgi:hypothetical protein
MPGEAEVPGALKPLLKRQAFPLVDRHWKQELEHLAQALRNIRGIGVRRPKTGQTPAATASVKIVGSKQWFLFYTQMRIYIDNKEEARLMLTDEVVVKVEPGHHTIWVSSWIHWPASESNKLTFDLKAGEMRRFLVSGPRVGLRTKIRPL